MAQGVNKVILVARSGADPTYRLGTFGGIVTLGVATGERVRNNDGQFVDETEWHQVVFKRELADFVRDNVHKGDLLYIEGRNNTRRWEKGGIKHQRTEIQARHCHVVSSRFSTPTT